MFPPKEVYQGNPLYELAIFDLRVAGSAARLSRARTAWRECAEPEILGEYHVALVVYPGGARSLAS